MLQISDEARAVTVPEVVERPTSQTHLRRRILLADDHVLLRDLLAEMLSARTEFEVVTVPSYDAALAAVLEDPTFDLVILDDDMPGMSCPDALARLCRAAPALRVAILSGAVWPGVEQQVLSEGAAGFLPKTITPDRLVEALRGMAAGKRFAATELLDTTPSDHPLASQLTGREFQALGLIVRGLSNKEIARCLGIREPTVKLHVKTLYRKIGAANRTQAAMIARRQGLL